MPLGVRRLAFGLRSMTEIEGALRKAAKEKPPGYTHAFANWICKELGMDLVYLKKGIGR